MSEPTPVKTFICYAREDLETVKAVQRHLKPFTKSPALLDLWSDEAILPGQQWDEAIRDRLEKAELILLFVSVDFIDSDYIEDTELQTALQRHRDGEATLVS